MAFPTSPVDNEIYNNYVYNETNAMWRKLSDTKVRALVRMTGTQDATTAATIIAFNSIITDTHGGVTGTGSSFAYTAPMDGTYILDLQTQASLSGLYVYGFFNIYINQQL